MENNDGFVKKIEEERKPTHEDLSVEEQVSVLIKAAKEFQEEQNTN